jgi:hypothetical protein
VSESEAPARDTFAIEVHLTRLLHLFNFIIKTPNKSDAKNKNNKDTETKNLEPIESNTAYKTRADIT